MEKVGQQILEYTIVSTVKYLHALDVLYEDQQRELKKWTTKAKDAEAKTRTLKLELLIMRSQLATMREKKEYYRQELMKALERPHHGKRSRKISKGKWTFAMPRVMMCTQKVKHQQLWDMTHTAPTMT